MSNLQKGKKHELIKCFNRTSRYLDDILNIDNPYFEQHIVDIYPSELKLTKANNSNKQAPFLDLNIRVIDDRIHTSIYDKRDDFGFPIVNYPWLDGDVPRLPSYGIYISQLVCFARGCSDVADFHHRNKHITSKLLSQGYRYHKLRKTFGKFFRRYAELLLKYGQVTFTEFVSKGISHPPFYGDLIYKLRRIKNDTNCLASSKRIIGRILKRKYDPIVVRRTVCMVLGPSTVYNLHTLFHCTLTNQAGGTR